MNKDQSGALVFCRFCLSFLFLWGGWVKLLNMDMFAAQMAREGMPHPEIFPYLAVFIELAGGLALLFGLWTRTTAVLFAIYIVVATLIDHRFWEMPMPAYTANRVNFTKNVAIVGGMVLLTMMGPGRYSIDAYMQRRRGPLPAGSPA
jgi:putative oxidoreductase